MRLNGHLHPSNAKLAKWVSGEMAELDDHIENCLRCASRLENPSEEATDSVNFALMQVLRPPSELRPRIEEGIHRKLSERGDAALIGDLLSLPYQTARILAQGANDV